MCCHQTRVMNHPSVICQSFQVGAIGRRISAKTFRKGEKIMGMEGSSFPEDWGHPVKVSGQKNLAPESSGVCKDQVLTLLTGDKEMSFILLYY